jgi:hypothetical protein
LKTALLQVQKKKFIETNLKKMEKRLASVSLKRHTTPAFADKQGRVAG